MAFRIVDLVMLWLTGVGAGAILTHWLWLRSGLIRKN